MTRPIRLLLLIPHLGGGGAERVVALLAQHLDPARFDVHLCLIADDCPGAQPLPEWVSVHRLGSKRVRYAGPRLLRLIHEIRPAAVLAGIAHLNFLLLLLKSFLPRRTSILVRQNTTASSATKNWLSHLAYRRLYPRADAILCQSESMAGDLATYFHIPRRLLAVVYNPIDIEIIRAASPTVADIPAEHWPRLLAVGRLSPEKGLDLLLRALPQIRQHYPQLQLQILGAGPAEAALRRLSAELHLETVVTFAGFRQNLADYYCSATLFVLPSRYEGMPNALLEAAAAGLPLVATPCSAGLCDLLRKAPGTWLTPSISAEALGQGILDALGSLPGFMASPQRFEHAFLAPFALRNSIAAYAALIERAASKAAP